MANFESRKTRSLTLEEPSHAVNARYYRPNLERIECP